MGVGWRVGGWRGGSGVGVGGWGGRWEGAILIIFIDMKRPILIVDVIRDPGLYVERKLSIGMHVFFSCFLTACDVTSCFKLLLP